ELGCTLLERGRHGAVPTEEGLLLIRRAEALIELANKTEDELRAASSMLEGSVAICCGQTAALDEMAALGAAFRREHPRVSISLLVTTAESSIRRLQDGRADLAVLLEPFDPAELDYVRLQTQERWVAVMGHDDPLAVHETVTAADLASGPVILPLREGAKSVLASWFGRRFSRLEVSGEANLSTAGDALVRFGMGRSLQIAPQQAQDDLVRVPFDPPLTTGSALAWPKGKTMARAAAAFVRFAQDHLQERHAV
ncbi:MAG: LysR family transcriptional regulator substrate-binding protein, partial [Atopobiaceae bacterium]|nr:LysR family transcriptional regulator substrate-binding protein [Atopobiaceae bacterium]